MKRRKFLELVSLGLAGTTIGIISLPDFENIIEKIIVKDTADLAISPKIISQYLAEAKERDVWQNFNFSKREFFRSHYFLSNSVFRLPYYSKYVQYRSEIVGNFLLSTDFFTNKMDPNHAVQYVGLYDPYFRPCGNPFSNLYYQIE